MKICAYCTTQNRDEAIFCSRCKRPLQATFIRSDTSARRLLNWLLIALVLIGLCYYFLSSRSSFPPTPSQTGTFPSASALTAGPQPTRTPQPVTPSTCIENTTVHIRRGPGTQYETIGGLMSGVCFTVLGRNEEASWVYIVSEDHQMGWMATSLLSKAGDLSRVSIRDYSIPADSTHPTLTSAEIAYGAQALLTQVVATNLPEASLSRYMMPCSDTVDRIGDQITCKLEKAYCDYLPSLEGSPTSCNDRPYPDQTFTLLVLGRDWSEYDGQCLVISGYLEVSRGALQIQALNRSQISSCN